MSSVCSLIVVSFILVIKMEPNWVTLDILLLVLSWTHFLNANRNLQLTVVNKSARILTVLTRIVPKINWYTTLKPLIKASSIVSVLYFHLGAQRFFRLTVWKGKVRFFTLYDLILFINRLEISHYHHIYFYLYCLRNKCS